MKRSKEKITLSILLAAVLVVGIVGYMIYVQRQFYTESTKTCWRPMSRWTRPSPCSPSGTGTC